LENNAAVEKNVEEPAQKERKNKVNKITQGKMTRE
jgi:hypothetical protein